jgi:hypothetical protein
VVVILNKNSKSQIPNPKQHQNSKWQKFSFVIPAEAGIHAWIPAYAGMTLLCHLGHLDLFGLKPYNGRVLWTLARWARSFRDLDIRI